MESIPEVLSRENYDKIIEWLGTDGAPQPDFAGNFITTLGLAYSTRTGGTVPTPRQRTARVPSLTQLISEAQEARQRRDEARENRDRTLDAIQGDSPAPPIPEDLPAPAAAAPAPAPADGTLPLRDGDGFLDDGRDSLELAGAIAWHHSRLEADNTRRAISMTFLQAILYETYGTCLAQRRERIVSEHPQMWQFGPVFARVYGKLKKDGIKPDADAAERIRLSDPILDEFLSRTVRTAADRTISSITGPYREESSPWTLCRQRNGDKWSTPLDDAEIAAWFGKRIKKYGKRQR